MRKYNPGFTPLEISDRGCRCKSLTGFTLIELLIAVLIFSIITTVIYSTFATGTSVWKRTKKATKVSMSIDSILNDLAEDLRSAVNYKGLEFIGEANKLYFSCLSETINEEKQYAELYRVSYYVESNEEGRLDLLKRKAPLIKGGFSIDEIKKQELIGALDEFKIKYAYKGPEEGLLWQEEWKHTEDIPSAIRIDIKKEDVTLTKYISIPTGKLTGLEEE